jgi:mycothiol synthase
MIWPPDRVRDPPAWTLPSGYIVRPYVESDEAGHVAVMRAAGFTWTEENTRKSIPRCLPGGFFVIVHGLGNKVVATAMATRNPMELHPFGGELGWVAGDPAHKGRGLGYAICAAVTKRFLDADYLDIYLRTDDFRLAAIKVYLNLGYVPFLFAPDMEGRWRTVCAQLGVDFTALRWAEP